MHRARFFVVPITREARGRPKLLVLIRSSGAK